MLKFKCYSFPSKHWCIKKVEMNWVEEHSDLLRPCFVLDIPSNFDIFRQFDFFFFKKKPLNPVDWIQRLVVWSDGVPAFLVPRVSNPRVFSHPNPPKSSPSPSHCSAIPKTRAHRRRPENLPAGNSHAAASPGPPPPHLPPPPPLSRSPPVHRRVFPPIRSRHNPGPGSRHILHPLHPRVAPFRREDSGGHHLRVPLPPPPYRAELAQLHPRRGRRRRAGGGGTRPEDCVRGEGCGGAARWSAGGSEGQPLHRQHALHGRVADTRRVPAGVRRHGRAAAAGGRRYCGGEDEPRRIRNGEHHRGLRVSGWQTRSSYRLDGVCWSLSIADCVHSGGNITLVLTMVKRYLRWSVAVSETKIRRHCCEVLDSDHGQTRDGSRIVSAILMRVGG